MQLKDFFDIFNLPKTSINLMFEKTVDNEPFYAKVVMDFFTMATARHPKLLFARKLEYGFALCRMPADFETYFKLLKSQARGNYRKALRSGYTMQRFDYNAHLDQVREIQQSTDVRQGELPENIREGRVQPINDPGSKTPFHDYPYFGVFRGGKLLAYASCMVAGELSNINDFFGHANYEADGVVSLLVIEMIREVIQSYPTVKYIGYGTYFGASESMRRFKRKFLFYPYHVAWVLQNRETHAVPAAPKATKPELLTAASAAQTPTPAV